MRRTQNFCEITTLSYVVMVKSMVQILQNFVEFLEYINFIGLATTNPVRTWPSKGYVLAPSPFVWLFLTSSTQVKQSLITPAYLEFNLNFVFVAYLYANISVSSKSKFFLWIWKFHWPAMIVWILCKFLMCLFLRMAPDGCNSFSHILLECPANPDWSPKDLYWWWSAK